MTAVNRRQQKNPEAPAATLKKSNSNLIVKQTQTVCMYVNKTHSYIGSLFKIMSHTSFVKLILLC